MSNKYYIPKTNKKETAEEFKRVNERILEKFRSRGLTIDHYEMGNSYFIFYHGENAVMHFKLKEAPQWRFGVWLTKFKERKPRDERSSGDYINIQIFAQNELWIDKFKPSRSYFCEELNVYWGKTYDEENEVFVVNEVLTDEKIDDELWDYQLIDPFALLWNDNNLAFYLHMEEESFDRKYITRREADKYMKDYLKKEKREKAFKNKATKATTKKILKYAKKNEIKDIKIIDRNANDSGWRVSPAFNVIITLDPVQFVLKSGKFTKELRDLIIETDGFWYNKGKKKKESIYYYSEFSSWSRFIVDGDEKHYYVEEEDPDDGSLDETNSYDGTNLTLEKALEIIKEYEDQLEKERQEYKEKKIRRGIGINMAYNLKFQKRENARGTFTPKVHELSEKLLGRQMTITELRLLPYLDSCIKDFNILENKLFRPKVSNDEIEFIHWLEEQGHVLWQADKIMVTKEFYDFMKEVLWESYVGLYLDQR